MIASQPFAGFASSSSITWAPVTVELLRRVVGCASNPGDLVLDPFCGSATTGVACLELGRRFVGIEKSERFAELARLRLKGSAL
jgi:DNA modification methylase